MRFNTGKLTVTASNASKNTPWPTYLDASGSAVLFNDGVTLTMPGVGSLSLVVANFFFFFQNNAATGTAQIVLSGQANGAVSPARAPQFLNGYSEVPFVLKGATYTFTNGYYASLAGTGTVHLYGNVQVDYIAPGITVVDHRTGAPALDTYLSLAYAASLTLDFTAAPAQLLQASGNLTITATAGRLQGRNLRLHLANTSSTAITLSFPAWDWRGAVPTALAAGKRATLSLECAWGAAEMDIIAGYAAQP
ncbi:hypothetical protein [Hymenobacter cheonanensis]|uniref:hypothetical protein n=1 Tax=Hymenobacter sp. CA2-7 TaxID=3063993 RepID=UPI002712DD3B|nr:hypothetical protein [Hymenobacter sp. CA2-7]MDO7888204.1 hypothetical protein [Hymenobacter sp. CA2-7]